MVDNNIEKKHYRKIIVSVIFLILTIGLIIGYDTVRLSRALKEKKGLSVQLAELKIQKDSLEGALSREKSEFKAAGEKIRQLEAELGRLHEYLTGLSKAAGAKEEELGRLVREKASLKEELGKVKSLNEQITANFNAQMKDLQEAQARELNIPEHDLVKQLREANNKLAALALANDVLEKQVESLAGLLHSVYQGEEQKEKAQELKTKVEVILTPEKISK